MLTMAFAAVSAVMVFYLFSTAQLANQKTKLQNTADAAAFSSGVLQARDYNFAAYTNRAMIANHVAMAQFVSLDSWEEELQREFKQDLCIPPPIPFGPIVSKCSGAFAAALGSLLWNTPQTVARNAAIASRRLFNVEKPLARLLEPLIAALRLAQTTFHVASLGQFMAGTSIDAVVKANDPNARISRSAFDTGLRATTFASLQQFTKTLNTQPELKRFANVTVDSAAQDGFTRSRNMPRITPAPFIPYSPVKPLLCPGAAITGINMDMAHGGGTQLSQDLTHWFAIDSAGVAGVWGCVWFIGPFPVGFVEPVTSIYMDGIPGYAANGGSMAGRTAGYGPAYSSPNTSYYQFGQVGGAILGLGAPAGLIRRYVTGPSNNVAPNYRGIRAYDDIASYATKPPNQVDARNIAPTLTIEVEKAGTDIRTAAQVLPGNNLLKLNDNLKSNVMRVVASSQAYFLRPARADHRLRLNASYQRPDNKTEYASLYSPYWQARLVATPRLEVEASTTAQ